MGCKGMDHFCDKLPTLRSDFQAQAHVVSTHPQNDLLAGRSVVLKDNIALAGLRCTNGTDLDLYLILMQLLRKGSWMLEVLLLERLVRDTEYLSFHFRYH